MTDEQLAAAMVQLLSPGRVLSGPSARRAYECDAYSIERSEPGCVVLPHSTEDVVAIIRWCRQNDIPWTPRGAGTGLSGGALAARGGVVISTKRMNRVLEIDVPNRCLRAQAGIANKRISDAVAGAGLHFAPDPSSQTVATLGGNIAENSGGPHTLKYGVTSQHVLSVKLVTVEGEVVEIGSRVAGGPGLDLRGVVVGSEGTVGIVTEAWVRLTPVPAHVQTALIAFPTIRAASESVAQIIGAGVTPAALEMMDAGILLALRAAFGLEYPAGTKALLLVECDGESLEQVTHEMECVAQVAHANQALNISMAANEADRQKLWTARKKGIGAMGRLAPTIVTHDGVIPRSKLPEMLEFVSAVARKHDLKVANLFHAGDGNLHPCFYFDEREPGIVDRVIGAGEEILRRCIELGGSVTGEHGIGVEKLDFMELMFTPDDLELQRRAKAIFDPDNLGNPCKVLPNQKGCLEHRLRWRGVAT